MEWIDALLADGTPTPVFAAIVVLGAVFFAERWAASRRFAPWFDLAIPLPVDLLPIARPPRARSGAASGVSWEQRDDGVVLWWASRGGHVPTGLHGTVRLARARGGVHLDVRWSPPLTPLAAAGWLAVIGAFRNEAAVSGPLAALLVGALLLVYHRGALQAARVLRWSLHEADGA